MDSAIWSTWYDLPEGDNADYFKWMDEEYLPALRKRDGTAWVAHYKNVGGGPAMEAHRGGVERPSDPSVPTGTKWVQIVGAGSPLTFLSPSVIDEMAAATGRTKEMLARRVSPQTFLMAEVMRANGPAYKHRVPGTTLAPAIQHGSLVMKTVEAEGILAKWYAETRLPLVAELPGMVSCRVYSVLYGWSKFAVIYEYESLEARLEHFEPIETKGLAEGRPISPLRGKFIHVQGSPVVGSRVWPKA